MERTETKEPVELIRCALNLVASPKKVYLRRIRLTKERKSRQLSSPMLLAGRERGRGPEGGGGKVLDTHRDNQPQI